MSMQRRRMIFNDFTLRTSNAFSYMLQENKQYTQVSLLHEALSRCELNLISFSVAPLSNIINITKTDVIIVITTSSTYSLPHLRGNNRILVDSDNSSYTHHTRILRTTNKWKNDIVFHLLHIFLHYAFKDDMFKFVNDKPPAYLYFMYKKYYKMQINIFINWVRDFYSWTTKIAYIYPNLNKIMLKVLQVINKSLKTILNYKDKSPRKIISKINSMLSSIEDILGKHSYSLPKFPIILKKPFYTKPIKPSYNYSSETFNLNLL